MIKIEKVKDDLRLRPFGAKGWLSNSNLACPECSRKGKFGIKQGEGGGVVHCFFCDYTASLYKYLIAINRKDLIAYEIEISLKTTLKRLSDDDEDESDEIPEVQLPKGFKRIFDDEYLNRRGWLPHHYEEYQVGTANHVLSKKLRDYLIFSIFQEGKRLSWLARTKNDYNWHKQNIEQAKEGLCKLIPRYRNSDGTEFDRILGGIDAVTDNTHTVILVEGMFDCTNTDTVLGLRETQDVRCCFTFGNKISDSQIEILKRKKGIETVILMYDYDTIKQSKTYGLKLSKHFNTYVTLNENPDIDPGNMDLKFAVNLLKNKMTALEFYLNMLNERF